MITIKAVSALEKILLHTNYNSLTPLKRLKAAKGERVSFQLALKNVRADSRRKIDTHFKLTGGLAKYAKMFRVGHVPVHLAAFEGTDDNYISKAPGLYPDVLFPIGENDIVPIEISNVTTVWITVDLPKTIKAGVYTIGAEVTSEKFENAFVKTIEIEVKKTVIAQNDLIFTQWLHCDCIADYFKVPMMSKKHWTLIEQFIKTAAHTGITMLLTPLFTPPLDTKIGSERPTMQLVTVSKSGDKYSFDFSLLDKWVKICKKHGIKYYEMSHLFTQWGAGFCPKIIVDGKAEFGWHTESTSEEYQSFLKQLLPKLTEHLKELGIAECCYFHISDEPSNKPDKPDFDNYKAAKEVIAPYLKDFKLMDALSSPDYFDAGLVDTPVPYISHIDEFMSRDIKERWCYYCCTFEHHVSDRLMAMPSARTRILGTQLFMYDMSGFLQWGFNYYYSGHSLYPIDPFFVTDADNQWPAGNAFTVYPYNDGAIESIRSAVFYEGLQDRMLLKMLADKIGKDKVKKLVNSLAGMDVTYRDYPREKEFITLLHDTVLDMLG